MTTKFKLKRFQPLEKDIQFSVCDYLARKRYFFWRQNTSGIYDPVKGIHRRASKWALAGVPDIIVIKDGKFIGLEVKRPTTVQNEAQKNFERETKLAGGEYHIIRSIEDIQKIL